MCGLYTLRTRMDLVAAAFDVAVDPEQLPLFEPRERIAPTEDVPIVRMGLAGREIAVARWGLIPRWSTDGAQVRGRGARPRPINARSETADSNPMFRASFRDRRCLIPADGFYEWKTGADGKSKQPYLVTEVGGLFAMAGLWERWTPREDGEPVETCVILTTPPNPFLASLHDRMPAILPRELWEVWLDPATGVEAAKAMLVPLAAERTAMCAAPKWTSPARAAAKQHESDEGGLFGAMG